MKKLSCADARQIDMVDYLASLGHHPQKIRNQDYWYCSPLRMGERTPSFKVNRARGIWFDFGDGKGGDIIDFGVQYFKCSINELLEKLSTDPVTRSLSFHRHFPNGATNSKQPSQSVTPAGEKKEPAGSHILIIDEHALAAASLLQYLQTRCIPVEIARHFCREVNFELYSRRHIAIGFKNDKGGFELRNEYFKGSSSPKATTFYDKGRSEVTVFEGFFDFLSFQALHPDNSALNTNFLVLNSLVFFHQSKVIMDKHQTVNLYLDQNKQGMDYTRQALNWDQKKYHDRSIIFRQGQDMNDWFIQKNKEATTELLSNKFRYPQGKSRGL